MMLSFSDILEKFLGANAFFYEGDASVVDRWKWLKRHLQKGPLRTLDAGCGTGEFTIFSARIGNESVGISFDEENNRRAQKRAERFGVKNISFLTADLRQYEQLKSKTGLFDQIICLETIEHIIEDEKFLRGLVELLKPGGSLFLSAPNKNHPSLAGEKLSTTEDGGHVRPGYSHEDLRALLNRRGLEVVRADYLTGSVSFFLIRINRFFKRFFSGETAWLLSFPFRIFHPLDRLVTKLFGRYFLSVAVIAKKSN